MCERVCMYVCMYMCMYVGMYVSPPTADVCPPRSPRCWSPVLDVLRRSRMTGRVPRMGLGVRQGVAEGRGKGLLVCGVRQGLGVIYRARGVTPDRGNI